MRHVLLATLVMLALGCGPSAPTPPKLGYAGFGNDESGPVMPFALMIENTGGPAEVDEITARITGKNILGDVKSVGYPRTLEWDVALMDPKSQAGQKSLLPEGVTVTLPAGKRSPVMAVFAWQLPDNPPPLLAIVSATFTLRRNGRAMFTSPDFSFVMQSQPGTLVYVMRGIGENPDQDAALLRVLRAMDAKPSASIQDLRERLEASFPPAV